MSYTKTKAKYKPSTGEITTKDTKVVPDEAFSVRDLLIKHASGVSFDNFKTPYYEEQSKFSTKPLNVIQNMDNVEKLIYLQEVQAQAKDLELKIQAYKEEQDAQQQANQNEGNSEENSSSGAEA